MKEWLLFILFMLVGLGMFGAGLVYRIKEKGDPESVKIYTVVGVIGAVLIAVALLIKFVF
ncbi:hypothetical protein [Faecalispora jeddahensis]|uniref:hypothetical protein n=1 Tax=Faecalispora jeddahensis TaxID=1414721 RepID=UPI00145A8B18|nr:hypothetical protein [Faecalispora jeddahensis]